MKRKIYKGLYKRIDGYLNGFVRTFTKISEGSAVLLFYVAGYPSRDSNLTDDPRTSIYYNKLSVGCLGGSYIRTAYSSDEMYIKIFKHTEPNVLFQADGQVNKKDSFYMNFNTLDSHTKQECLESVQQVEDMIVEYFLKIIGDNKIMSTSKSNCFVIGDRFFQFWQTDDTYSTELEINFSKILDGKYKACLHSKPRKAYKAKKEISSELFVENLKNHLKPMHDLSLDEDNWLCKIIDEAVKERIEK